MLTLERKYINIMTIQMSDNQMCVFMAQIYETLRGCFTSWSETLSASTDSRSVASYIISRLHSVFRCVFLELG